MEWTIQDLGAAGEFMGSIAVLITLIYLAVETKQTQRIVRAQYRHAWADSTQYAQLSLADSDYIAPILAKLESAGFPDSPSAINELDTVERVRYRAFLLGNSHRVRSHLYQISIGLAETNLAPPRGSWERPLRAAGMDSVADELESLYESTSHMNN